MAELSVIIPTYAQPRLTVLAVESAAYQDADTEIIVVDDASPAPFALPGHLVARKNIRLVRRDFNGGAGAARNTGVALATSKLITFLDSDDLWLPNTLGARLAFARSAEIGILKSPALTVGCGWIETDNGAAAGKVRIPRPSRGPDDFFGGCWMSPGSVTLFNRALFAQIGGYDENLRRLEDLDLFIRIGLAGGRFVSQGIAGAIIRRSFAKSSIDINFAAEYVVRKHSGTNARQGAANRRQLRLLRAYIELEIANDARRSGRYLKIISHLARSFATAPRLRVPLAPGWTYAEKSMPGVVCDAGPAHFLGKVSNAR